MNVSPAQKPGPHASHKRDKSFMYMLKRKGDKFLPLYIRATHGKEEVLPWSDARHEHQDPDSNTGGLTLRYVSEQFFIEQQ